MRGNEPTVYDSEDDCYRCTACDEVVHQAGHSCEDDTAAAWAYEEFDALQAQLWNNKTAIHDPKLIKRIQDLNAYREHFDAEEIKELDEWLSRIYPPGENQE